jgi:hypothetical protein
MRVADFVTWAFEKRLEVPAQLRGIATTRAPADRPTKVLEGWKAILMEHHHRTGEDVSEREMRRRLQEAGVTVSGRPVMVERSRFAAVGG